MKSNIHYEVFVQVINQNKVIFDQSFNTFPILIGRSELCHVSLHSSFLSRVHASISIVKDRIYLMDLNSSNGTLKDGNRIYDYSNNTKLEFEIKDLFFIVQLKRQHESLQYPAQLAETQGQFSLNTVASKNLASKRELNWTPDFELAKYPIYKSSLQGVLTWDNDIYEITNYSVGEKISLGSRVSDVTYLPLIQKRIKFGKFYKNGAEIHIADQFQWSLNRKNILYSKDQLQDQKLTILKKGTHHILLEQTDILSVDLDFDMKMHFRYVSSPRPFYRRSWIENKEVFKKAIQTSALFHVLISILLLFGTPKHNYPHIENVPPRFAKLLIEPPSMVIPKPKPPPPVPPPPPPVEPPKVRVIEEPPKVIAQPKKIVIPKTVKAMPKLKTPPAPQIAHKTVTPNTNTLHKDKPLGNPNHNTQDATPKAEVELQAILKNMGKESSNMQNMSGDIKLNKGPGRLQNQNAPVNNLVTSLGKNNNSMSNTMGGTSENILSKVGGKGYVEGSAKGQAGHRNVLGKVVGSPAFTKDFNGSGQPQGLSDAIVMSIVNKHISEIHRCYERALFNDPSIAGRVEYQWVINPEGSVNKATVIRSDIGNGDFLNQCVIGVFRNMQFPKSKNALPTLATIGFPFGKK